MFEDVRFTFDVVSEISFLILLRLLGLAVYICIIARHYY
jgi:hypothetical protein